MKRYGLACCALAIGALSSEHVGAFVVVPSRAARQQQVSLSRVRQSAVPYIPDGYSEKEWQAEHGAELAELQTRKEEFIGQRGVAAQPVRHLSEDIDQHTHVHFHKPSSAGVGNDREAAADKGETILQKMRRQWGRDGDDDDVLVP